MAITIFVAWFISFEMKMLDLRWPSTHPKCDVTAPVFRYVVRKVPFYRFACIYSIHLALKLGYGYDIHLRRCSDCCVQNVWNRYVFVSTVFFSFFFFGQSLTNINLHNMRDLLFTLTFCFLVVFYFLVCILD